MTAVPPGAAPTPPGGPPRSKAPWLIGGGVVLVLVIAFLAFGVFGVQTLFTDEKVDEANPFGEQAVATTVAGEEPADPDDPSATTEAPAGGAAEVTTAGTGSFEDVDHPGEGTVNLLTDGTQTFVRFEDDFSTDNGPDLYAVVYVGDELIELDTLKGNQGAQNYELPADIDPATVTTVAVWCKRFDSTFTEAAIS